MDAILAPETIPAPEQAARALVAEANHRIANSLTLLVSMVRMQASAAAKRADILTAAEVRQMLEGVAARIGTIGQLHRLLSHVPQDGCTSLMPHLRDVSDALVAALSSPQQTVTVAYSGNDCLVLTRQVQPIILIICEVFINAMKYAHPAGAPLVLQIDCAPSADGRLVLTISDDGVGLPEGFDPATQGGLGFRVIRSLAGEVGATLEVTSTSLGLSFRLSMPGSAMPSGKPS
jgi:two-component sensor histidine kinase